MTSESDWSFGLKSFLKVEDLWDSLDEFKDTEKFNIESKRAELTETSKVPEKSKPREEKNDKWTNFFKAVVCLKLFKISKRNQCKKFTC